MHLKLMVGVISAQRARKALLTKMVCAETHAAGRRETRRSGRCLPRWSSPSSTVHALVLPGRHRPAKIAAALELLRERAEASRYRTAGTMRWRSDAIERDHF